MITFNHFQLIYLLIIWWYYQVGSEATSDELVYVHNLFVCNIPESQCSESHFKEGIRIRDETDKSTKFKFYVFLCIWRQTLDTQSTIMQHEPHISHNMTNASLGFTGVSDLEKRRIHNDKLNYQQEPILPEYQTDGWRSRKLMASCSTTCFNGGSCIGWGFCNCAAGYTGSKCETDIDECASSQCLNGATCVDGVNLYTCNCASGYTSTNCQTDINECLSTPCLHGSTCADGVNGYTCSCWSGYTGVYCETNINECLSSPCLYGGSCTDGFNGFKCTCVSGYTGVNCQTNINECASTPCVYGGTCVDVVSGYTCICWPGYTGLTCETNIDECASSPCINGAVCHDHVNGYTCVCLSGYTGSSCETDINECNSDPCMYGGICTDSRVNYYTCQCPVGTTGIYCETNFDDCAKTICLNGGHCVDLVNAWSCDCAELYEGPRCETEKIRVWLWVLIGVTCAVLLAILVILSIMAGSGKKLCRNSGKSIGKRRRDVESRHCNNPLAHSPTASSGNLQKIAQNGPRIVLDKNLMKKSLNRNVLRRFEEGSRSDNVLHGGGVSTSSISPVSINSGYKRPLVY